LTPRSSEGVCSRELPSIYLFSVGKEKCVTEERKYF
jgi:hypothetical protein